MESRGCSIPSVVCAQADGRDDVGVGVFKNLNIQIFQAAPKNCEISSSVRFWPFPKCLKMVIFGGFGHSLADPPGDDGHTDRSSLIKIMIFRGCVFTSWCHPLHSWQRGREKPLRGKLEFLADQPQLKNTHTQTEQKKKNKTKTMTYREHLQRAIFEPAMFKDSKIGTI